MKLTKGISHARWQEDLSAYVDGRLASGRQQALGAHLSECLLCQRELAGLREVVALLRRVPQAPVPRSFTLSQAPARRPWWLGAMLPLRYATAVAAVLLVAVITGDLVIRSTGTGASTLAPAASPSPAAAVVQDAPEKAKGDDNAPDALGATDSAEAVSGPAGFVADLTAVNDDATASSLAVGTPAAGPPGTSLTREAAPSLPETPAAARGPLRWVEAGLAVAVTLLAAATLAQAIARRRGTPRG
ncbi:MAG: zf-HC2 domain-containing protein [Chloroflexi bacterium]|nr:zf-HC2 domain-containing protein [Chloroflexota bacterium]